MLLLVAWQVRMEWRSVRRSWRSLSSLVTLPVATSMSSLTSSRSAWSRHHVTLGVGRPGKSQKICIIATVNCFFGLSFGILYVDLVCSICGLQVLWIICEKFIFKNSKFQVGKLLHTKAREFNKMLKNAYLIILWIIFGLYFSNWISLSFMRPEKGPFPKWIS